MRFLAPERGGKQVMRAEGLSKAYGCHVLLEEGSLRVSRGDKVGLIGANGAGKSTLLKMMAGRWRAIVGRW